MKHTRLLAGAAVSVLVLAACGSDSGGRRRRRHDARRRSARAKARSKIIAWAGYAEDGSTDPAYNWVGPFEDETGCKTDVKIGNTSDEMFQLMSTGEYDGVSASGDSSVRLIDAGQVAPVNVDLIANYKDLSPFLKDQTYNTKDGVHYGVPHGWGANLLMWNTDVVTPAPDSWGAVFDPASPYKGKVTAYDTPIYIADAGLYLMKTKPDLGIKDPYSLTRTQFDAAVDAAQGAARDHRRVLEQLRRDAAGVRAGLAPSWARPGRSSPTWRPPTRPRSRPSCPRRARTAWSDTWMVSSKAKHPNCMYLWMDYITRPDVQAQVAAYFGEAPANPKACDLIEDDTTHCDVYKATDKSFYDGLYFWATPRKQCLDGSGERLRARSPSGSRPGRRSRADGVDEGSRGDGGRRTAPAVTRRRGGPAGRVVPARLAPAGAPPVGPPHDAHRRARGVAAGRLPRLAGGAARHVALHHRRQRPDRREGRPLQLPADLHRARLPDGRASGPSSSRPR